MTITTIATLLTVLTVLIVLTVLTGPQQVDQIVLRKARGF